MRKRLLALALLLTLACALAPGLALADEGGGAAVPVAIEIGSDGAPVGASGDGWTYENDKLVLEAGYAFTFTGSAYTGRIDNNGVLAGGMISGTVFNLSNDAGTGIIAGGTFSGFVSNYGGVISSGTFNKGSGQSENNSVDNKAGGTIDGGEFNIGVNNSGSIEDGTFNGGAQNYPDGTVSGGTFDGMEFFNNGIISGGVFNSDTTYNFGEIRNGTFGKAVESDGGTISGGTFASTGSVLSYYGGIISGGTFDGPVSNCDSDFDPKYNRATITGGTFAGTVTNYDAIAGGTFFGDVTNRGIIAGGFFACAVVDAGGTIGACTYSLRADLTGLSLSAAVPESRAAGAAADVRVAYDAESGESNRLTLVADEGYTLPAAIVVRVGDANGPKLAAGADYTYDAATGAIAIKKNSVTGPLLLAASGVPSVAPPEPAPPTPTPPADPVAAASKATALAATSDSALPHVACGVALLAGSALLACVATRGKRSRDQKV